MITKIKSNLFFLFMADVLSISLSLYFSYLLRFEGNLDPYLLKKYWQFLPFFIIIKTICFIFFGLYKEVQRYVGLIEILNVLKSTSFSSLIIIGGIGIIFRFHQFSRAVFIIDAIMTFLFISGVRLVSRIIQLQRGFGIFRPNILLKLIFKKRAKKRLLIIGAGDAAEKIMREIISNPHLNYEVVGFLDDDSKKKGMKIHGKPILGEISIAPSLAKVNYMDEILIAISSATSAQMKRIIDICDQTYLKYKTIPGIGELINGQVSYKMIREVSYEDLLGRDEVKIDLESIGQYLKNKTVLVTGAGGSIGSELCRQIILFHPKNLILLDKTENNLFSIEMEFKQKFTEAPIIPVLGDIQNKNLINKLFSNMKPDVVFHAAAFKHVPMIELHPWEGIFNNIVGTLNILEESFKYGIERFVLISTDKAVNPISVMGATKRVAEIITLCYAELANNESDKGKYVSVRFGNVIGTEGSVVHLFKKQIEKLGPVTITHPEMTRYFMTIKEACKLILQAGAIGKGGEIFVLDMGKPIKVLDMACDIIRMCGYEPYRDIEIKFIGLRPGERLYEELFSQDEQLIKSVHEKILILKTRNEYNVEMLKKKIEELISVASEHNEIKIKAKLKEIVPEYQPSDVLTFF